jgi:hypothetical protein
MKRKDRIIMIFILVLVGVYLLFSGFGGNLVPYYWSSELQSGFYSFIMMYAMIAFFYIID